MTTKREIDHCIEQLCNKGCRAVWNDIAALERGVRLPETDGLADHEVVLVLKELKAVMAVYEGSCSPE